jgi:hypothetical protein
LLEAQQAPKFTGKQASTDLRTAAAKLVRGAVMV